MLRSVHARPVIGAALPVSVSPASPCYGAPPPTEGNMTGSGVSSDTSSEIPEVGTVDMKLEVVTLPVSDVDRAKRFYQSLGWREDADFAAGEDARLVQMTPPHSQCSIHFGKGFTTMEPGSLDRLYLAVKDIDAARNDLISRGVDVSEVKDQPKTT